MITNDFRAFLLAFSDISTLTTEIMLWPLPETFTAFPAITYQQDNENRTMTHAGQTGLVKADVRIDVWGYGAESVKDLAGQVVDNLRDFKGNIGDGVPPLRRIYQTEINNMIDLYETDTKLDRVSISVSFWHKEITPVDDT